jgi:hypothetical protein
MGWEFRGHEQAVREGDSRPVVLSIASGATVEFLGLRTALNYEIVLWGERRSPRRRELGLSRGRVAACIRLPLYHVPTHSKRAPFGYEMLHKLVGSRRIKGVRAFREGQQARTAVTASEYNKFLVSVLACPYVPKKVNNGWMMKSVASLSALSG